MPNPRHRPPLRLADPAAEIPDWRTSVARALLDRCLPFTAPVDDQGLTMLCPDGGMGEDYGKLQADPRFLIGRLMQALTALLAADVPPMDATAQLLGEAIHDAISYRRRTCPQCAPEGICAKCWPNWRQANAYEGLWLELGIVDQLPPQRLRAVENGDGK